MATVPPPVQDALSIGAARLGSRLIHGTGKFANNSVLAACLRAAAPEMITLAVRRLGLDAGGESEMGDIDLSGFTLLPNTAGATTADQAVRLARLGRAAGLSDYVKVEVIGDEETLLPDPGETLEATRQLVAEGFTVLPYTSDDVVQAIRLAEAGAAAVMPLAAPIGTTLGVLNPTNIRLIIKKLTCPVIVDAGLGVPSDAARCMEWGAAGVLVNTAIARAQDPPMMARAFAEAVRAGRRGAPGRAGADRDCGPGQRNRPQRAFGRAIEPDRGHPRLGLTGGHRVDEPGGGGGAGAARRAAAPPLPRGRRARGGTWRRRGRVDPAPRTERGGNHGQPGGGHPFPRLGR